MSAGFLLPHSTLHIHLQSCCFVLSNLRFCLVCCASLQRLLRYIGAADFSASIHGTVNLGRCCEQTGHVQDHSICISLLKSLHCRVPGLLCKCSCCSHPKPYLIRTIQAAQFPSHLHYAVNICPPMDASTAETRHQVHRALPIASVHPLMQACCRHSSTGQQSSRVRGMSSTALDCNQ